METEKITDTVMQNEDTASEAEEKTEEKSRNEAEGYSFDELRGELNMLKERVEKIHGREALASELRSLLSVVPNADLSLLDDEAFEGIERGESLVFSYLLSERRRAKAEEKNRKNSLSSAGEARGGNDGLYTLDEIKNMDRRAVRRNFDKVMRSLEKAKSGI